MIYECVVNLQVDRIESEVRKALDRGVDPHAVLEAISKGSREVGRRFENGEYYLSDLVMAGETMRLGIEVIRPFLKGKGRASGKIVIGTVEGDLHDIGKNIVSILLSAEGFEVFDLGIDVPPKRFAEKVAEVGADIVGVSALLSVTVPSIRRVTESLEERGLRSKVKIIAGGAPLREEYAERLKIDAAVNDAVKGLAIIKSWLKRS
jgi:5-methyltetrahydrofolate--homocysteine methyltransferase